jgi:hypothetical protein
MPARFFTAEGPNLYGKYLNGSIDWAESADIGDLGHIYPAGYLPFSGNTDDPLDLFYMSRSLRVDINRFSLKKKRRYDHREWTRFGLERELVDKDSFVDHHGPELLGLAKEWMQPRFGDASLPGQRLAYILSKQFLRHILVWRHGSDLMAFALVAMGDWGAHYWYVFYRNGDGMERAPGHGFLVDFLVWCQSANLPHAYLGTAYAGKSRYKSRGIHGTEFWDGDRWNTDMMELARLQEQDEKVPCLPVLAGP